MSNHLNMLPVTNEELKQFEQLIGRLRHYHEELEEWSRRDAGAQISIALDLTRLIQRGLMRAGSDVPIDLATLMPIDARQYV